MTNLLEHPEWLMFDSYPFSQQNPPGNWDPVRRAYVMEHADPHNTYSTQLQLDYGTRPRAPGDRFTGWWVPNEAASPEALTLSLHAGVLDEAPWTVNITAPAAGVAVFFDLAVDYEYPGLGFLGYEAAGGTIYLDDPGGDPTPACFWTDHVLTSEDCAP